MLDAKAYKRAAYPPPLRSPYHLSDEDIAHMLNVCSNANLSLVREKNGREKWRCRVCGLEVSASQAVQATGEHFRPEFVNAWA